MKKGLLFVTVGLTVPFLFSCAEKDVVVPLRSLALDQTEVTLRVGEETTLKVTKTPENATTGYVWESSNPNSVGVTAGQIKAYSIPKDGNDVVITVFNKEKTISASCSVHVNPKAAPAPVAADGITVSASKLDFVLGDPDVELFATVTPLDAENRDVTWTISNTSVVTQVNNVVQPNPNADTLIGRKSSSMVVRAIGEGNTLVTATDASGSFSASIAVNVVLPEQEVHATAMHFAVDEVTVVVGHTAHANALAFTPYNATYKDVTYSSSNNNIASVSPTTGVVTGVAEGDATITATLVKDDSITASYSVHVEAISQKLVLYRGLNRTSVNLSLKDGSETEYVVYNQELQSGDEFVALINGTEYGFDVLKQSGCYATFKQGSHDNYIRCEDGVNYDIYIETGDPDDNNDRIYISANYIKCRDTLGNWYCQNINLKFESETEYMIQNVHLYKDYLFLFNLHGTYLKFDNVKSVSPVYSYFSSDNGDIKVNFSGNYTIYADINDGIYIEGAPLGNYQIHRNGAAQPEDLVGLALKPGFHDEFYLPNIALAVGDKIRFALDGYFTLKNGGLSSKFSYDNATGYLTCNEAGNYDFYAKFMGEDLGIYVAAPVHNVIYTVQNFDSWWTSDSAHIYAWAFIEGESGHWYEGIVDGSNMKFTIPSNFNKAIFVRVSGQIADLSRWDGSTFEGMNKWNRADNVNLNGSDSNISFTLGEWHD